MIGMPFIEVCESLDIAGLIWRPEIGDEVSHRDRIEQVSILVDPQGMTPIELRKTYLWLPTVEQIVDQLEARQAVLFHTGLDVSTSSLVYKTVIQVASGHIESEADSLRMSLGLALRNVLAQKTQPRGMH